MLAPAPVTLVLASAQARRRRSNGMTPPGYVECPYCAQSLMAQDFAAWTSRPQLLSIECACGRTVTMAAVTLRRRTAR